MNSKGHTSGRTIALEHPGGGRAGFCESKQQGNPAQPGGSGICVETLGMSSINE